MYTPEQDRQFCNYVRQFRNIYRVRRGEDGVWEIVCKNGGDIEPYSLTELSCFQAFKSERGIKAIKRRLPEYCNVTQECGTELVFKFPSEYLDEIAVFVGAYRRRHLSESHRAALIGSNIHTRFKRHGTGEAIIDVKPKITG